MPPALFGTGRDWLVILGRAVDDLPKFIMGRRCPVHMLRGVRGFGAHLGRLPLRRQLLGVCEHHCDFIGRLRLQPHGALQAVSKEGFYQAHARTVAGA